LGERLLCKQEVVGSIPSGSTNLRGWGRFGWWTRLSSREGRPPKPKGEGGRRLLKSSFVEKFYPRARDCIARARALSDIVKRRSTQFGNQGTGIRDQKNLIARDLPPDT
jgi:hypothetical protein